MINPAPIYPVEGLEIRKHNKAPLIRGLFPYNNIAVISDSAKTRKETIEPGAFTWTINAPERDVHILVGHDWNKPLGSKLGGNVDFRDSEEALEFLVEIPPGLERATYVTDLLVLGHVDKRDSSGSRPMIQAHLYVGDELGTQPDIRR